LVLDDQRLCGAITPTTVTFQEGLFTM